MPARLFQTLEYFATLQKLSGSLEAFEKIEWFPGTTGTTTNEAIALVIDLTLVFNCNCSFSS